MLILRTPALSNARPAAALWAAAAGMLLFLPSAPRAVRGDDARPAGATPGAFFREKIEPILSRHCYSCHSAREGKQRGGLELDSLAAASNGGDSSQPAIVPGQPGKSLLIRAVSYDDPDLQMPPKQRLSDEEIALLERWIRDGAHYDDGGAESRAAGSDNPQSPQSAAVRSSREITEEDRSHWAYRPVPRPTVPETAIAEWSRHPIDRFVADRLVREGLAPAPRASRATLIRRVTYDLTGLPPTPEQVAAFLADDAPDAYERLVDRLLDSPRYGEKWARHWLDVVRYAESDGYRADAYRPTAWRYRDYVIQAFNDDLPYDQFVREQLAADELAPDDPRAQAALGYLRLWIYEFNQRDLRRQWDTILTDVTDVTAEAFLAMSFGCARCHDHKFDAIRQEDYYRLRAFLAPLYPVDDQPLGTPQEIAEYRAQLAKWEAATEPARKELEAFLVEMGAPRARADAIGKFPDEIKEFMNRPVATRTPGELQLTWLAERQVRDEGVKVEQGLKGPQKERYEALLKQIAAFDALRPRPLPTTLTVCDVSATAPETRIPGKEALGPVEPMFPLVLERNPQPQIEPMRNGTSTGRRAALARWLTRPDHPLTSRVMVNRVWQWHFGRGIVASSSDFGRLGDAPTHPELLDWLAQWFVQEGWSLKRLHRLIVTSQTYQQASHDEAAGLSKARDPENRWLGRFSGRRLEAEEIRDTLLVLSGELDERLGGEPVEPAVPRRSIYLQVRRNVRAPLLDVFDVPDGSTPAPVRNVTTTPTQALLMANGAELLDRAGRIVRRLTAEGAASDPEFVARAWQLGFGRDPQPEELSEATEALQRLEAAAGSRDAARIDFIHALLNANELIYVD